MSEMIKIVIVGGGTAGWMFAAALSKQCSSQCQIVLVESEDIGTVGVGEATQPQMKAFNDQVGLNEAEFMSATQATFKLGIEFVNWGSENHAYTHPFGTYGDKPGAIDFLQHWIRATHSGIAQPLSKYSYAVQACEKNLFEFPSLNPGVIDSTFTYAYHFDAGLYVNLLKSKLLGKSVTRIEGRIRNVALNPNNGDIQFLELDSGETIGGDYFVDCSGFKSLLLGETLDVPFDDWSHWLLCDRAIAIQSEGVDPLAPYTQSTAHKVGWRWKIPLQHRTGNGYVYCSDYIDDNKALELLLGQLEGKPLSDPRFLKFKTGYRKYSWVKNCISAGLSSGFLEPLESTSLYLIQAAINNFLEYFPEKNSNPALIKAFNFNMEREYLGVRDFLILHYCLTSRTDSDFWSYCKNMSIPDSLKQTMAIFKKRGFVDGNRFGAFQPASWISVMLGQGGIPQGYNPMADTIPLSRVEEKMKRTIIAIDDRVSKIPSHNDFVAQYCGVRK